MIQEVHPKYLFELYVIINKHLDSNNSGYLAMYFLSKFATIILNHKKKCRNNLFSNTEFLKKFAILSFL